MFEPLLLPAPPPALDQVSEVLPPPALVPVPVEDCPPMPMFCRGEAASLVFLTPRAAILFVSVCADDPLSAPAPASDPAPDFDPAPASDSEPPAPDEVTEIKIFQKFYHI